MIAPTGRDTLVQLHAISKEFKSGPTVVRAVKHVSLSLSRGEFVLLQGPSGSGKTTLLSVMGCLMKPTRGRVWLQGQDVTNLGEDQLPQLRLKHIGFIFQSYNLFPALTAFQNIKLALQLKGFGWRQRRREAQSLLDQVGLTDCMHRKPGELSGGQRQRVCIARALAGDSAVILADEPTAALDTQTGLSIMNLLRDQVLTNGKAAMVVTHDPRLEKFATRVDYITDGVYSQGSNGHRPAETRILPAAEGDGHEPAPPAEAAPAAEPEPAASQHMSAD